MRRLITCGAIAALVAGAGFTPEAPRQVGAQQPAAGMQSIGSLAFGPENVLFAADTQGASIYAFELDEAGVEDDSERGSEGAGVLTGGVHGVGVLPVCCRVGRLPHVDPQEGGGSVGAGGSDAE
jgi:hypothetical protein